MTNPDYSEPEVPLRNGRPWGIRPDLYEGLKSNMISLNRVHLEIDKATVGYGLASDIEYSLDEARRAMELTEATWEEMVTMRDDAQDQAIKLLAEVQELQMKTSSHMIMSSSNAAIENEHFRLESANIGGWVRWRVIKKGTWPGTAIVFGAWRHDHGGDTGYADSTQHQILDVGSGSTWSTNLWGKDPIVVFYTVAPGVAMAPTYSIAGGTASADWVTVQTVTTSASVQVQMTGLFRITWGAADRGVTYGIRALVNGQVVGSASQSGLGPLTPLGSGVVSQSREWSFPVPVGGTLEFQVYASGGSEAQRKFNSGLVKLSWVQP